ncbi:MAG TPA: hypothetical protein VJR48_03750 [Ktedonobacterales bacterium]|nr:hypothetical protein [Ktedonobacterales bacterium]
MSFPVLPPKTTASLPAKPSLPDSTPTAPVPHATGTPTPRWSVWALASAICGIVTAAGVVVAKFDITAAEVLCVAAGPALACGFVGLVSISESKGRLKGRGFAVVGLVMGVVGLIVLDQLTMSQLSSHFKQYPPFHFPSDD